MIDPCQAQTPRPVTVADMMAARDRRAAAQRRLLACCKLPLVSLTMNIAGEIKRTPLIARGFSHALEQLRGQFLRLGAQIEREERTDAFTGPEALFAVRAEPRALKTALCALEDATPFGRLLDIDVLDADGRKLGREDIGLAARRCLLCGERAAVCARARTHSAQELFARAQDILRAHLDAAFCDGVSACAQRALLCEVAVTPKPGLVDRANSGAHADMDVFTFLHSASALTPYFRDCARVGLARAGEEPPAVFAALRPLGVCAEGDMLRATAGVNTHKGAIFSLGILCAAAGVRYGRGLAHDEEALFALCARMTGERLLGELRAPSRGGPATAGERQYAALGVTGARGEAASGFASVRAHALPALRAALSAGRSLNDAGVAALLALMAAVPDTNLLKRGGEAGWRETRDMARALPWRGGAPELSAVQAMDDALIARNLSPGGCADLLSVALFAHFLNGMTLY